MSFLSATLILFFIMDPLGNIPIFQSILKEVPERKRTGVMIRELIIAYIILMFFLMAGRPIMNILGLKQSALSITGGIVLFLIAIRMVFPQHGIQSDAEREDPFIVPLAMPLIAGPSAIATLLLMAGSEPDRITAWIGALSLAWGISFFILLSSGMILQFMGQKGLRAMAKLMGMLLIMMAVQMFLDGLQNYIRTLST
jgi:multiple antibiotic resistance protein